MNQRIVALDLGSAKVAALAAERGENGKIRVLGATTTPCKGLRRGAVVDLDEAVRSVDEALRDLQNELVEPIEAVLLSVGGSPVEAVESRGLHPLYPKSRPITRDDVMQVINHSRRHVLPPDREEIQAIPRSYGIDGQQDVSRPIGMVGSRLEVSTLLITAQTSHLQNLERAVATSGRKVSHFVQKGLAAGLGVLTPEQIELGCAIVDIGAGTAEVAVFSRGSLAFCASVPVGSGLVTSDISKLLKTSIEEAERLKLKSGHASAAAVAEAETVGVMQLGQIHERPLQRRVLCEIVESRTREMATMVRQQLERSGTFGMLPGGVVLTGGGSQLPGIAEMFHGVLQHHKVTLGVPKVEGKSGFGANVPDMAVAVGIARFALDLADDELSTATSTDGIGGKIKTIWSLLRG